MALEVNIEINDFNQEKCHNEKKYLTFLFKMIFNNFLFQCLSIYKDPQCY